MSSWKKRTVYHLGFIGHFWATVQFSFFIPTVEKLFSLALVSWQPGEHQGCSPAKALRKTAADGDKNN